MIKWLKRIGLSLLVVIALLAVWIYIGSIDQDSFDDRGLLSELKPVPDAENGFLDIAYMGDENYKFGDVDYRSIDDIATGRRWDIKKADRLLAENKQLFDAVRKSNDKPLFSVPEKSGINKRFFQYQNFTTTNRLFLIKARKHVQDFEYDKAIDSIEAALNFSLHVQSDAKDGLLPWMIGLYMQAVDFAFLHELVSNYDMTDSQYQRVGRLMSYAKIDNDNIDKVIYGEFSGNARFFQDLSTSSISERYQYFHETMRTVDLFDGGISLKEKIFFAFSSFFPNYYVHTNKVIDSFAGDLRDVSDNIPSECSEISTVETNAWSFSLFVKNPDWSDFFAPNSVANHWAIKEGYLLYFQRRCLFYTYFNGVKAAVALKAYEKQHDGGLPKKLEMLIPDYMDQLPMDYFSNQPLRYSIENDWLYSVGADHKDDGGSKAGFYQGRCPNNKDACFNSPTIPLTAPQAAQ